MNEKKAQYKKFRNKNIGPYLPFTALNTDIRKVLLLVYNFFKERLKDIAY